MSIPTDEQFFSREDPSKPDVAFLKNHFYREGRLSEEQAMFILEKGTELLREEPNLLHVDAPVTGQSLPLFSMWHKSLTIKSLHRLPTPIPSLWRYSRTIREFTLSRETLVADSFSVVRSHETV